MAESHPNTGPIRPKTPPLATPPVAYPVWVVHHGKVGHHAKCPSSPPDRCDDVDRANHSWPPKSTVTRTSRFFLKFETKKEWMRQRTSRQTQANENTSLSRVTGQGTPSSSTRERMSSGAIQRVDPANKDVPSWAARKVASVSGSSSTTVDSPKSEIRAFPSSLMRMLVCEGRQSPATRRLSRGRRTPLRSPWTTTGFMLWR